MTFNGGTLGLEFKDGIELIETNNGFQIPKEKRVRIFNGGKNELVLIEILLNRLMKTV